MFERIVVGLDGSRASERGLELAAALAAHDRSEVRVVSVIEEAPPYVAARREEERDAAEARSYYEGVQRAALARLRRRGVAAQGEVTTGNEARGVIDAVREAAADLLAIGNASHSDVWGTTLGSTAHKLAHVAPCSVLVAREGGPIDRVLVGYDGSAASERALAAGTAIARTLGARVAIGAKAAASRPHPNAGRALEAALARLPDGEGAATPTVAPTTGDPASALRRLARDTRAQLVVVGATGEDHPWSRGLGNTAATLVERADTSVLVVRLPLWSARISQLMRRGVRTVRPDTPAREAAALLLRMGAKTLVVVDGSDRPVGILTLGDLLERVGGTLTHGLASALDDDELERQLASLFGSALRTAEVMTAEPVTVRSDATIDDALALMAGRDVKRLPVIDEHGGLEGLLSRADLLRSLAGMEDVHAGAVHRIVGARTAGELMRQDVVTVPEDAPVEETARAVLSSDLGRVAVVDGDDRLVGVVALRDLLPLATAETRPQLVDLLARPAGPREPFLTTLRRHPGSARSAASLMRRDVVAVRQEASLAEILDLLMTFGIRRLLVVDEQRRVLGSVDRDDVLRALAERVSWPARR